MYIIIRTHIHTFDGESGLHASVNVVSHVTVEKPSPWVPSHHLNGLESPGEEVKDICTVHAVRLIHTHIRCRKQRGTKNRKSLLRKGTKNLLCEL